MPLLAVLIRDGFIYYSVMLGISLTFAFAETSRFSNQFNLAVNTIVIIMDASFVRTGLRGTLSTSQSVFFSVVGSRIMLNLRDVAIADHKTVTSRSGRSLDAFYSLPIMNFVVRGTEVRSGGSGSVDVDG